MRVDGLWTTEEVRTLWDVYPHMAAKQIARHWLPGRTPNAIDLKAQSLGIHKQLPAVAAAYAEAKRYMARAIVDARADAIAGGGGPYIGKVWR